MGRRSEKIVHLSVKRIHASAKTARRYQNLVLVHLPRLLKWSHSSLWHSRRCWWRRGGISFHWGARVRQRWWVGSLRRKGGSLVIRHQRALSSTSSPSTTSSRRGMRSSQRSENLDYSSWQNFWQWSKKQDLVTYLVQILASVANTQRCAHRICM